MFLNTSLPPGYEENTLVLMVQTPYVLYAYWELSPCQRAAIAKQGKLKLRLNIVNEGVFRESDIISQWDSFYFTGVEPCRQYYCDISVVDDDCQCYPLIYSNRVSTPGRPASLPKYVGSPGFWGAGEQTYEKGLWTSVSSEAFYR